MTARLTPSDRLHRMKFTQDFRIRRFSEAQAARHPAALPRKTSINWGLLLALAGNFAAWGGIVALLSRWW